VISFHPVRTDVADAIDARRAPGEAVLKSAQEDAVEAPRLIVRDSQEWPGDRSIGSSPYQERDIRRQASTDSRAASRLW